MAAPVDESRSSSRSNSFKDKDGDQEISTNVRNILLVVVTLVVSVTFSAGVNPPGGVWQDNSNDHEAGRAILASDPVGYSIFLFSNTAAFSTSGFVIWRLVSVYPFYLEIWVATFAMSFTYAASIAAVSPKSFKFRYVFPAFVAPVLLINVFYWLRKICGGKLGMRGRGDYQSNMIRSRASTTSVIQP